MGKSKLSAEERLVRRRTAARLRQQKCRMRKRLAASCPTADKEEIETILKKKEFSPKRISSRAAFSPARPASSIATDEKQQVAVVPMGSFVPYFMTQQQQQTRVMQHTHISPIGKHPPVSPNSTAQFGMVQFQLQQQAPHRMRHPNAYRPGLIPRVVSDLSISQKEIHFSSSFEARNPSPVGIGHLQDDSLDGPGLAMEPPLCSTEQAAVDAMLSLQEHTSSPTASPVVMEDQKRFRLPYRAHHPPLKQFVARFGRDEQLHQGQVQPFV